MRVSERTLEAVRHEVSTSIQIGRQLMDRRGGEGIKVMKAAPSQRHATIPSHPQEHPAGNEKGIEVAAMPPLPPAAAARLAAKPENRGKVIVTVAASFGERYLSTPLFQGLGNEAVPATPASTNGGGKPELVAATAGRGA